MNFKLGETSLFTDPFLTFSRQFIQAGLGLFLVSLVIPAPLFIFSHIGDRANLLETHSSRLIDIILTVFSLLSHLLLPISIIFLFGLPSALILTGLQVKKIVFVGIFGSGHTTSELVVSLLIVSGSLPAIILLLPDRSVFFYAGTWLLPALFVGKTVAEAKAADLVCRTYSKKDVESKGLVSVAVKSGAFVLGLALGVGWIGRYLWKRRLNSKLQGEVKR